MPAASYTVRSITPVLLGTPESPAQRAAFAQQCRAVLTVIQAENAHEPRTHRRSRCRLANTLCELIAGFSFTVAVACTSFDAQRQIPLQQSDVVLLDLRLPAWIGFLTRSSMPIRKSC
jgi:hypothetical protein